MKKLPLLSGCTWIGRLLRAGAALCTLANVSAMTWSGDPGPWGPVPMNDAINTWNTYSNYGYNIPVYYNSGIPTAQANYMGSIGFGGQGNYRTAMHESSHWMGTGTTGEWDLHQRWSTWNGTYVSNLRRAYDGPGERQFIYGDHYGPQGANYDSEGVQGPQMVGIIGAYRRDQNLAGGDQTIGIASDRYRLRSRVSVKMLDNLGATGEGAQPKQSETLSGTGQEWDVNLIFGTTYFTIKNVANGKYLDSLGNITDGSPVGMTSLVGGTPTDAQLWQIVQTDSFFFKLINKANGKALDNLGSSTEGAGVIQWASGGSWNQQWTFVHPLAQTAPPAGVISQGRWVASSSTDGNNYDTKANNGVAGDRWTASSGSYPQWWQVDLGSVQPMTKVETDWFPGGVFQYRIEVSNDGSNFTVAADRTNNTSSGTTVDYLTTSGRFTRVVITGTTTPNWAAIMECRVYNEAEPMQMLSQFRPTTANSEQAGNLAVNATDVDPIFTRWCSASSGFPGWWQVDLGTTQQVNKAVIQWFDDDGRSYQYRVEGSTDGVNYTTLIDRTNNTTGGVTTDTFSGAARWVRVYVTGGTNGYPSIYEAQIYGLIAPQAPPAPQNFAATVAGSQINLSWATTFGATGYSVKRATTSGGPYTTIATSTGTTFSDTNVSAGIPYYYVVMATNSVGNSPDSTQATVIVGPELHAYLRLDETTGTVASDISGFARNGTLTNGPLWAAGYAGNAVDLDGTNDYVTMPNGVVSGLNDFTIAAWVNPDTINNWARLFDFGTGTTNYMFLAPSNGSALRFAIRTPSVGEQQLSGPPLTAGVWTHVAVTLSGNTGTLYVNGTAVATNNAMTLRPSSLGNTTNNWIGRAQFADPYLNGKVDDFRIYNRALDLGEIGKLRGASSATAPSSLIAQLDADEVSLNWSLSIGATNYQVKRATTSGGAYTTLVTLNGGSYTDTTTVHGMTYYYVVSAVNAAGESANSSEVSITTVPLPPVITSAGSADGMAGAAFSYQITASNSPTSYGATGLPAGLSVNTSSGLIDGSPAAAGTFFASISATNAGGTGNATLTINVLPAPPAAPTGLAATGGHGTAVLSWTASSGADTYQVKRATVSGGPYTSIATVSTPGYTNTGLANGTTYYYVVSGTNAGGEGANSAQASATTFASPSAPWSGADVGAVGIAGNATYNAGTGTYTLSGSGADIWGTTDAFQFVSQTLTGNGEIRARVTSITNTDPWAKAGVMIRDGSGAGATNAFMLASASNGFSWQWRTTASGTSNFSQGPATNPVPNNWVRLVRSGNLLTGYYSADGVTWTQQGTTTISMAGTVSVGLAVTSHNNTALNTATFDNVLVTPYPSPWATADIGTTGLVGSAEYFGGTHTVKGAGTFGGTVDGFRYVYQTLSADGSIIVRVKTLNDTGTNARVGIMMRDTLANNSRMAALTVTGSGGWRWERRTTTGGLVSTTNSSTGTAPNIWVRLVRSGNTVTAYRGTNGTSWTTIGSATVSMASSCYVGLAVASGSTSTLNTSVMDNVTAVP